MKRLWPEKVMAATIPATCRQPPSVSPMARPEPCVAAEGGGDDGVGGDGGDGDGGGGEGGGSDGGGDGGGGIGGGGEGGSGDDGGGEGGGDGGAGLGSGGDGGDGGGDGGGWPSTKPGEAAAVLLNAETPTEQASGTYTMGRELHR